MSIDINFVICKFGGNMCFKEFLLGVWIFVDVKVVLLDVLVFIV